MPAFVYRARGSRGDLLEGRVEAASPEAVASQLLNGGVTPVQIREAPAAHAAVDLSRLLGSACDCRS